MKKPLAILLIILPLYLALSLYFLDKEYFISPVEYRRDIAIRNDSRGEGNFAANRSGNRIHEGLDLLAPLGTPVKASRFGLVVAARQSRGMGKFVIIKHPGGINTLYGHLSEIYVGENEFVRQGAVIGAVGKTGNADSPGILPHLHFEVRKNNSPQDPLIYLE